MKQSEQTATSNSFVVEVDIPINKIKTLKSTKNTHIRRKLTNRKCNSGSGKSSRRRQHYPFNNAVEHVNTVRSVLDTTELKTEAKEELYDGMATIRGEPKALRTLYNTGSTTTLINEAWVERSSLKAEELSRKRSFLQAGQGKMIATSFIRATIDTPYGVITNAEIPDVRLSSEDLILGRDTLDKTNIMLNIELRKRGLNPQVVRQLLAKEDAQAQHRMQSDKKSSTSQEVKEQWNEYEIRAKAGRLKQEIIAKFPDVFSRKLQPRPKLIRKGNVTHIIQIKNAEEERPTHGFYPIPYAYYDKAKKLVDKHIESG